MVNLRLTTFPQNSNIPSKPSLASVAKRSTLSASTAPQRVLQPPPQTSFANRPAVRVPRASATHGKTNSLRVELVQAPVLREEGEDDIDVDMDVEGPEHPVPTIQLGTGGIDVASEDEELHKTEVEAMVGVETAHPHPAHRPRSPTLSSSPISSPLVPLTTSPAHPLPEEARAWPAPASSRTRAELQRIREGFVDNIDGYDTTMVAEYADDIFAYMARLEDESMPGERYVDGQGEINWEMRQTLVDWLLQVHLRYHLLPETLWIAVNIVDRFLTKRVVSLVKLQLVGVTAMFIAAKYEEILAPRSAHISYTYYY